MEDSKNPPIDEDKEESQQEEKQEESQTSSGWGGGWGFSAFSVLSDLQKKAEEISRNAAVVAEKAAKSIADLNIAEDSPSSKGEPDEEESASDKETQGEETEDDKLRKSALDKLEKASEDTILGQGLKVLDHSVENLASGAWQALGSAWKGGSNLVQKLENSAVNLADSIQHGSLPGSTGSVAPSLLETGKAFTAKGMQVLEYVGKETMDLLITETGIEVEKNTKNSEKGADEDHLLEEMTFDRCFYIYGGPEQLEELEALSNHYALLFNRRKAKLSSEEKSAYDGKLKLVQQIFSLSTDGNAAEFDKGKKIESATEGSSDEMKSLHDSSVSKAADMAAGFTNALAGQSVNDIIQRTAGRLETLHSEGVHRLSEMCCSAMSQLLMLGKSVIFNCNKAQQEETDGDIVDIDWPEDSVEKAKMMRTKARSMTGYVEAVSNSFITGISDVAEAYAAAIKGAAAESHENSQQTSIQEKVNAFSELLRTDRTTAVSKIQDGLQYLSYVVISTSMPAA
ncbi:BAT2 DOMAIN PROTEIN [Salix koriyanagi]|uniref:BAT2 DOMAIN PROTEIN n=1 Tax=Salix koriyanagi TaxID=2511006 RepID=A0A9Q0Z0A2_9ROSI|nr:BAT2 DOMAIN PROTEIN [Salix koriyanagi]